MNFHDEHARDHVRWMEWKTYLGDAMKPHEETVCARCNHERWHHLDFHYKPRSCAAKDDGEQCLGFVEPFDQAQRILELEAALRVAAPFLFPEIRRGPAHADWVEMMALVEAALGPKL